jgi:hypothetical protein
VLVDVALHEEDAALGIKAGGEQLGGLRQRVGGELGRVVLLGHGVEVDDAVDGVIRLLVGHPVAHGPEVVAQMRFACRLDSGEDACHARRVVVTVRSAPTD